MGSDRIGELLPEIDADVIVNVQGDEPELDPALLDRLVGELESRPDLDVATAACPLPNGLAADDPNAVKVVMDAAGRALYFSRAPIPGHRPDREPREGDPWARLHLGVYAYRRAALERFLRLPQSALEQIESLEQLRLLENGMTVGVVTCERAPAGVDTRLEFEAFRQRVESSVGDAD